MTRAHKLNIAGKTAIIAALMGGSSLSLAQDAVPTVAAPTQPAPVAAPAAPVVAPPPAVSTLPSPNDVINPVAAQEAAVEAPRQRQTTTATSKIVAKPRVVASVRAAPTVAVAPEPAVGPSTDIAPPIVETIEPSATIEDSAPVAPVDQAVAETDGFSTEDMTLVGGLAAALAAIGLGAAFASRRRRRVGTDNRVAAVHAVPEFAAPRPIKEDPVFQQFATTPAPVVERPIQRAPVKTRAEVPLTDPLFSAPVAAAPITDPLFAPRNDIEPPIIDPLFAKNDRFVGRAPAAPAVTRERELVN